MGLKVEYTFKPIGVIHTPFKSGEGVPIQGGLSPETEGTVEVYKEYAEGLKDLDGFSHIILLYVFHKSTGYELQVRPFLDNKLHGLFSTRAPRRPNPVGLTVVKLKSVEENKLHIQGVDILDGTPLLDIKPYVPRFAASDEVRIGWLFGKIKERHLADDRFV